MKDPSSQSLDHAWAWFRYHAEQRVATMRFYLIALEGAAAGVCALNQAGEHVLCFGLSVLSALLSFCFLRMDRQSSDLVKLGEEALKFEQTRLARATGNFALEICARSTPESRRWPSTFGQNMQLLLRSIIIAFGITALISIFSSQHVFVLWHSKGLALPLQR